jgi:hypothetical protein
MPELIFQQLQPAQEAKTVRSAKIAVPVSIVSRKRVHAGYVNEVVLTAKQAVCIRFL